ncbi:MAG TPA: TonB-dependent receptor, partial [Chitinophagaceae bacterium]|nr:TonB-dependent receptor [Chitinophagaceae bacterium]
MQKAISLLLSLCLAWPVLSQHSLRVSLADHRTKEKLAGASVLLQPINKAAIADSNGLVIINDLAAGTYKLTVRFIGYENYSSSLQLPQQKDTLLLLLTSTTQEMDEVVVSSTRSNRTIRQLPTRIEFINGEELEEKANMKPGDIRMMLNESTGIQTQQVSASSANASIRIQGLDGRYTQLLKDGFPLFAGFSGGLGLLQTPPLDLQQVEIIKGSSSTLYGGGAIAGLVNLISKQPTTTPSLRFLLNGTSARGADLNGFYAQRFKKTGITLYAGRSSNKAFDPSNTGFTAIPQFERYVVNPSFFLYFSKRTSLRLSVNGSTENRLGGDIHFIKGQADSIHQYYERNKSQRFSVQTSFQHQWSDSVRLTIKNAISHFTRRIAIPGYYFDGRQWATYSEVALDLKRKKTEWISGLNLYTDQFKEQPAGNFPLRNYLQQTVGAFLQNTTRLRPWLQLETGLRADYINEYGFVFLPRMAALFTLAPQLTSRLGAGVGYKTPNIFTEDAERIQFENVLPVNAQANRLERSYGGSFDFNYRHSFAGGRLRWSINQLFFFTRINHPLLLTQQGNMYALLNNDGYMDSKGVETNLKLAFGPTTLYIGYTFTDAHLNENGLIRENPLTARHRLNNILVYEIEDSWKLGAEAYYYSTQALS